jgi:hypothetical protein
MNKIKVASYERLTNGQDRPSAPYGGVGTSYAAPIVAGYISLWLSHWPEKTRAHFLNELDRLTRRVEPVPACSTCTPRGLSNMRDLNAP